MPETPETEKPSTGQGVDASDPPIVDYNALLEVENDPRENEPR